MTRDCSAGYAEGMKFPVALCVMIIWAVRLCAAETPLSDASAQAIGKRIWRNECGGTVDGLTSWNKGEDFASLGIGHFIWYPAGPRGPFEESFPKLIDYFEANGVSVPDWLRKAGACPWATRAEFMDAFESARMRELRGLLAGTVAWQARFCALRLEAALPKMLAAAPKGARERIRANFQRVAAEPLGMYALIDYVNFKGEGTSPSERYGGQGWGLLQVLETMGDGPALEEFSRAANAVLTRRVANSPKARNEAKWLPGWRNRVAGYDQ